MKASQLLLIAILLVGCGTWLYISSGEKAKQTTLKQTDLNYAQALLVYDSLLKDTVNQGVVDYETMKTRINELETYLAALDKTNPEQLSQDEALAFWINAYNAFTLHMMLQHLPGISSIKDINSRWKVEIFSVNKKSYSLNHIEHEILRKDFEEPRIHFAIVCASMSCPDLRSEAFTAEKINEQLKDQTENFLKHTKKGFKVIGKNSIEISKIFSWFSEDFEKSSGSIQKFIYENAPKNLLSPLNTEPDDWKLSYFSYDWDINDHSFE